MSDLASLHVELYDVKKHSVRYNSTPGVDNPALASVYISKSALPTPYPKVLKITISEARGQS